MTLQGHQIFLRPVGLADGCHWWTNVLSLVCLFFSSSTACALQIDWLVLTEHFFSSDFFWRSGPLEYWILLDVQSIALAVLSCLEYTGTQPEHWLKLSFCVCWPYRFKQDKLEIWLPITYAWPSSTYPWMRILALVQMGIKLMCMGLVWIT